MNNSTLVDIGTKTVLVRVTLKESHLINLVRRAFYGEITVSIKNGVPFRVVEKSSIMLKDDEGLKLAERTNEKE